MLKDLTDTTFEECIAEAESCIVIFYKKLCPHCKNMEKCLEKVLALEPQLNFFKIDSEENPAAMSAFSVERVPTTLAFKEGKPVSLKSGLMNPMQVRAWYKAS